MQGLGGGKIINEYCVGLDPFAKGWTNVGDTTSPGITWTSNAASQATYHNAADVLSKTSTNG